VVNEDTCNIPSSKQVNTNLLHLPHLRPIRARDLSLEKGPEETILTGLHIVPHNQQQTYRKFLRLVYSLTVRAERVEESTVRIDQALRESGHSEQELRESEPLSGWD
jgi:hypothetical protein